MVVETVLERGTLVPHSSERNSEQSFLGPRIQRVVLGSYPGKTPDWSPFSRSVLGKIAPRPTRQ